MLRIVKTSSGEGIFLNPNKYQFGRSVYICNNEPCINTAVKRKKIGRMLKVQSNLVENIVNELTLPLQLSKEIV